MRARIEEGLALLQAETPPRAAELLERYGQMLLEKNQVMNLTAITDPDQVARLHMLDCAALLDWGDFAGRRLIDVGTGAGFPGLPLKILVPSLEVTLLDSLGKRVDWLRETAEALGLDGVACVHGRAEEIPPQRREAFDFAAARAVAALPLLAELCLPYVKVGGQFLAMKSTDTEAEIAAAKGAIRLLGGRIEAVRAEREGQLAGLLAAAQAGGEVRGDVDPALLAALIMALVREVYRPAFFLDHSVSADAVGRVVTGVFLDGVLSAGPRD